MNEPTSYAKTILSAMQGKHIYGGTVDPVVIRKRRAANKMAKASRKKNRK